MSQFYGVSAWSTGWSAPQEMPAQHAPGVTPVGWTTSWDESMSDATRTMAVKRESVAATASPNPPKSATKPVSVVSTQGWVEVTSPDGWTAPSSVAVPTTPTKTRGSKSESHSPPGGYVHHANSPNGTSPGPNNKRHHDIEDELGHQDRYKTELCRSWHESGTCRYGSKCQFAHGQHELRPVMRHPKYKTEPCRSWMETRNCPYGRRCRFIHADTPSSTNTTSRSSNDLATGNAVAQATNGALAISFGTPSNNPAQPPSQQQQQQQQQPTTTVPMSATSAPIMSAPQPYMAAPIDMLAPPSSTSATNAWGGPLVASECFSLYAPVPSSSVPAHLSMSSQPSSNHNSGFGYSPMGNVSPPYSTGFGFGMSVFNGSPPFTTYTSTRDALAAARASNAPWLYDTYQEDDADEEDDTEAFSMTPLIEQLNLHAEPISPTPANQSGSIVTKTAISRPAPIGTRSPSAASPTLAAPIASTASTIASNGSHASTAPAMTDPTADTLEKGKKKKNSRLRIFQRLSSK